MRTLHRSWRRSAVLPKIMATSWYRAGGQIVILYDTGYQDSGGVNRSDGGQIPMVVVSAHTRGMGAIGTPINTAGGAALGRAGLRPVLPRGRG
jgi:hypothetical protein